MKNVVCGLTLDWIGWHVIYIIGLLTYLVLSYVPLF